MLEVQLIELEQLGIEQSWMLPPRVSIVDSLDCIFQYPSHFLGGAGHDCRGKRSRYGARSVQINGDIECADPYMAAFVTAADTASCVVGRLRGSTVGSLNSIVSTSGHWHAINLVPSASNQPAEEEADKARIAQPRSGHGWASQRSLQTPITSTASVQCLTITLLLLLAACFQSQSLPVVDCSGPCIGPFVPS